MSTRKIFFVFISLIFVCLLSSSMVFAADNTTLQDVSNAAIDNPNTDSDDISNYENNLASIDYFNNDLVKHDGNISLKRSYAYDFNGDSKFAVNGITLNNRNINIEGNNFSIDMRNMAYLFTASKSNIKINNLNIINTLGAAIRSVNSNLTTSHVCFESNNVKNSRAVEMSGTIYNSSHDVFNNLHNDYGSAIYATGSSVFINNATFNITHMQKWGSIYIENSEAEIANTAFADMKSKYSTAIYDTDSTLLVSNCTFINLFANETAGAIGVKDIDKCVVLVDNCRFINVTSSHNGGALFADVNGEKRIKDGRVFIRNTSFDNCSSLFGGAILQLGGSLMIVNSTLSDNYAVINGGAVYTSYVDVTVINSTFNKNVVPTEFEGYNQGGAIYFDKGDLSIQKSRFTDNSALEGSDVYMYDANYDISDSYFAGNLYSMFDEGVIKTLSNNTFLMENKFNQKNYVYVYEGNATSIEYNPIYLNESLANASSFDLRDYGLVSPVKDQGEMGSCWAFGVTGAIESAYLKASNKTVLLDISETNIQDSSLMYNIFGIENEQEGSIRTVGTSYMLSWLGVTTSEDNTYDELGKISPIYDNGIKYHIHNVVLLETRKNVTDNQKFKEALVKYGAIGVSVHGASKNNGFNQETNAAYFYNETFGIGTDHTVTVVGWNDSYSKHNFAITPPGDGAWIIKNSWGTEWADNGYYYVSYYDTAFATAKLPVAFIIDNNHNYEKNYQYDIISKLHFRDYENTAFYANKFNSTGKDLIAAVGTYFDESDEEYIIEIYVNDKLVHTQKGISDYTGYDTIKLNKFISLEENDEFMVKISTGSYVPLSSSSRQKLPEKISFVTANGKTEDISADEDIACIKAYTIPDKSEMNINASGNTIQVKYFDEVGMPLSNAKVTVKAHGEEYTAVTDEDGIAIFKLKLPGGKHNVSVINPITCKEENITLTIPTDNKPTETDNPTNSKKPLKSISNVKVQNINVPKTLYKTYTVSVKDKIVYEGRYIILQTLNVIFGQNFANGHLIVYLDGKVVFNATVGDDLSTIILEIIDSLLGNHELKVVYGVGNDTQTYIENITIT